MKYCSIIKNEVPGTCYNVPEPWKPARRREPGSEATGYRGPSGLTPGSGAPPLPSGTRCSGLILCTAYCTRRTNHFSHEARAACDLETVGAHGYRAAHLCRKGFFLNLLL